MGLSAVNGLLISWNFQGKDSVIFNDFMWEDSVIVLAGHQLYYLAELSVWKVR